MLFRSTLSQEDWDSAFEAFPDLECLRLSGQGGFEDVFDSLYPYSDTDGVIETSEIEAAVGVRCPSLKSIVVGDVIEGESRDDSLLDVILETLHARAEQGTRLDRIEIQLLQETGRKRRRKVVKEYVSLFEEVVGEVVFV